MNFVKLKPGDFVRLSPSVIKKDLTNIVIGNSNAEYLLKQREKGIKFKIKSISFRDFDTEKANEWDKITLYISRPDESIGSYFVYRKYIAGAVEPKTHNHPLTGIFK